MSDEVLYLLVVLLLEVLFQGSVIIEHLHQPGNVLDKDVISCDHDLLTLGVFSL